MRWRQVPVERRGRPVLPRSAEIYLLPQSEFHPKCVLGIKLVPKEQVPAKSQRKLRTRSRHSVSRSSVPSSRSLSGFQDSTTRSRLHRRFSHCIWRGERARMPRGRMTGSDGLISCHNHDLRLMTTVFTPGHLPAVPPGAEVRLSGFGELAVLFYLMTSGRTPWRTKGTF
jgi:hypothetical protein